MSALTSKALQEQLSAIMAALTAAAVAEICELVDEGYAELHLEISRSHRENEDLKQKLHLIESIVVRGSGGGGKAAEPEVEAAAEVSHEAGTPPRRDGGAAGLQREELPEVVLIKDEDSDSNDTFDEDNKTMAVTREAAISTPVSRSVKRRWPGHEEAEKQSSSEQLTLKTSKLTAGTPKTSVVVYTLDSPRSEPGCSGQFGGEEVKADSSQMDPDVHLVHQECSMISPSSNRQTYFGSGSLIESPTNRGEMDLSLTWSKHSKSQMPFPQFHQNENVDVDGFGLKLISVSGSTSTDCQLSESSNSAFEYEDADMMNYALYRDPSGPSQVGQPSSDCLGKRFICSMCNKTYATSQNLDVHMRIHTGVRPFSCCQCGKKFTQSAHLKSHLSVHSGERPYACTFCSRSFIVKYSLKLHMKKCHPTVKGNECVL
ncbi:zinc finger protein interacting with ribonucleoprotein K-like [Hippoglossus stenolepis]|uniref:zinc finger protein interacting with ribonucleoprotein K-like n=1 Tax=Hippoglossus stenolepis TaxID=195615 RepID=UPI0017C44D50|nr:zinc finger protein interacting with ribonucleoprotein K-like [Hippoglossus stenolepis]